MGKKQLILLLGGLAVVSFGISLGVSHFILKKEPPKPSAGAQGPGGEPASMPAGVMASVVPALSPKEKQLEDLIQELKSRVEEARKREAELDKREKRLAMAQEALGKQAKEIEDQVILLKAPLTNLQSEQKRLKDLQVSITALEAVNLKKTAAIYEKMDAASGGKVVEQMCAGSQEDDAAKILRFMSERSAAKLMQEISDKALVARLCDKMKRMKEES